MDLSKLTPAPFASVGPCESNPEMPFALASGMKVLAWFKTEPDCDLAALGHNAFDVMMRRGPDWLIIEKDGEQFLADCLDYGGYVGRFSDPFTAWVEADKWYRENVELKPPSSP